MKHLFTIWALFAFGGTLYAQMTSAEDEFFSITTPVTFSGEEDELASPVDKKEEKRKRNYYYGIKTKKGFTRIGSGDALTLELFHFLKEPQDADVFVRDVYWYDYKRNMIRVGSYSKEEGALLHGPYKKVMGEQVLDSGVFYLGLKHGTWMYHDNNDVLVDKEKYYKGWPRESQVRYYDRERTRMREIIPIEFGEREGNYYYFFENGRIAVRGEYKWDRRIGDWIEYYPSGRRKKVIRYPKDPYGDTDPFVYQEWNSRGREVYNYMRASR